MMTMDFCDYIEIHHCLVARSECKEDIQSIQSKEFLLIIENIYSVAKVNNKKIIREKQRMKARNSF